MLPPKEEVTVAPISDEMDPFESRRLWQKVADGIRTQNYDVASREKSKIENDQRQMRKDEAARGEKWPLKHFTRVERDPDCTFFFSFLFGFGARVLTCTWLIFFQMTS